MQAVQTVPRGAARVELPHVVQQRDYTCGAAVVLAVSQYYGVGPSSEEAVAADMRFGLDGSDPVHLIRALRRYGLAHVERRGMTDAELRALLDHGAPVILMLQAWGDLRSYRHAWTDGHWVVAIGHDARGLYVEDPMIVRGRGFLSWAQLADRWHDVEGRARRRVVRYGLILRSAATRSSRTRTARFARRSRSA